MAPTLVLDLDGTLVDSAGDLRASLNRLMSARGLPPFTTPEVTAMIGDGVAALVGRAMEVRGTRPAEEDVPNFLADYTAHAADHSRPFPGVERTLRSLRDAGWRLAVCTNKPEQAARAVLQQLALLPLLDVVGGGDSFAGRKPDPAHIFGTVRAAGGDPAAAVAVGDHRNDVLAASRAGIPCIFARWGYGQPDMEAGAAATAERFTDVPAIARGLLAAGSLKAGAR